jgi:hypothetical protein
MGVGALEGPEAGDEEPEHLSISGPLEDENRAASPISWSDADSSESASAEPFHAEFTEGESASAEPLQIGTSTRDPASPFETHDAPPTPQRAESSAPAEPTPAPDEPDPPAPINPPDPGPADR